MLDDEIFGNVSIGSEGAGAELDLIGRLLLVGRQHEDMGVRKLAPQHRERLLPAHDRHTQIEENHIGVQLGRLAQRVLSVARLSGHDDPDRRTIRAIRARTMASSSTMRARSGWLSLGSQSIRSGGRAGRPNR